MESSIILHLRTPSICNAVRPKTALHGFNTGSTDYMRRGTQLRVLNNESSYYYISKDLVECSSY